MNMLVLLMIPLWLAAIVGFIWLVVRAFKTSTGWGLGVFLLSPLSAILYALKYWDEAKKPFLVYMMPLVGIFGVLLYMFISAANSNPVGTNVQTSSPTQQGAPLEPGKIEFMEKSLAFVEKFAQTEKDKQFLAVMRQYIHYMKSGPTDIERMALKQDIAKLLERPDLTEKQRQDLTKILQQLEQQEKTTPAMLSESAPQQKVTASPVEKAETPNRPQEAKPKVQPVSLNSESKSSLPNDEVPQKPAEMVTPPSQPKDVPNVPITPFQPKPEQSPYKAISVKQAKHYIGSSVVLIGPNDVEQEYILADVSDNILRFEKHFSAGVFSFYYKASEIKSLKIYQP